MIVLSDSTQPTARTTTSSRRESTSTTSPPPPYESSPSYSSIHDERRRHIDAHSNTSKEPLTDSKVYAEPPRAFSRIAAVSIQTLVPFSPMTVLVEGSGKALDKGFSLELPPSSEAPHPFERRDISAADWNRFMQDLQDCTALPNCTKNKTLFIPIALGFGPGACFISEAIKAKMRKERLARAINLINAWNQYFFVPRRTEVILMRGDRALTISKSNFAESLKLTQNDPSTASLSSLGSSSSSTKESRGGCFGQPKVPMKLIVVAL